MRRLRLPRPELQEALGVTAPTLRDRLKLLQGLGFVEGVKAGRTMRWSLTEEGTALLGLPAVDATKNSPQT